MKQRQDNWDLVLLLLDLGARYSEIAELTWQQVDLKEKTILLKRSKTNNEAVLYMSNRVYQVASAKWYDGTGNCTYFRAFKHRNHHALCTFREKSGS